MELQQHLPFTVLKRTFYFPHQTDYHKTVATALTVHGIETAPVTLYPTIAIWLGCNSTYRSRY